jgi:hypothetical protein
MKAKEGFNNSMFFVRDFAFHSQKAGAKIHVSTITSKYFSYYFFCNSKKKATRSWYPYIIRHIPVKRTKEVIVKTNNNQYKPQPSIIP